MDIENEGGGGCRLDIADIEGRGYRSGYSGCRILQQRRSNCGVGDGAKTVQSGASWLGRCTGVIYQRRLSRFPNLSLRLYWQAEHLSKMASFDTKPLELSTEVESATDNVEVDRGAPTKDSNNPLPTFTANEERTCLRKIDAWLMPIITVTYGLQYVDKVILNGASQFGIVHDLDLYTIAGHDEQTKEPILNLHRFSLVTLIFYWGYLAGGMLAA